MPKAGSKNRASKRERIASAFFPNSPRAPSRQVACDLFRGPPGSVNIGLHLDEGDRTFRQTAVGMEDRVVAVLPPLIGQALSGSPLVFDEAVAVPIAVAFDPVVSRLDMRPQLADGFDIACPLEIFSGEHDEERGRIDAAVVAAEWNFAQIGHLPVARFVQNFSRLRVGLVID